MLCSSLNDLYARHATTVCRELLVLKQNFHRPLVSGHYLVPKLQNDDFEVCDTPRYAFFDNLDFVDKKFIDHFHNRLGEALAYSIWIAALSLPPARLLRRAAVTNLECT